MRARGDLLCLHEPFIDDYYLHRSPRVIPHHQPRSDMPVAFDDVCDYILQQANQRPVFFKDMSYYVMPHLFKRQDFVNAVTHCFIVRHPHAAIASYYSLDANITRDEIGYESQWLHHQACCTQHVTPVVIAAEQLQQNPQQQVADWWQQIGLPHKASAFQWDHQVPQDWQRVAGWHAQVLSSTGIRQRQNNDDKKAADRFAQCVLQRPQLQEYLTHHLPFYQQLLACI